MAFRVLPSFCIECLHGWLACHVMTENKGCQSLACSFVGITQMRCDLSSIRALTALACAHVLTIRRA